MNIRSLDKISESEVLFEQDMNDREIRIYKLEDCKFSSYNLCYPNVVVNSRNFNYSPMQEKTMSLENVELTNDVRFNEITIVQKEPVFFFVYNTDNYYHFVYDTLPYLITFFELKKNHSNIKLLMNFPFGKKQHYKFVTEFLEILNLTSDDIVIIDENTKYEKVFFSTSYTHGHNSNAPPRKEIFDFFKKIKELALTGYNPTIPLPKKFYISRRSWVHGDASNIGTNYTLRRRLENEDNLVDFLNHSGFVEIFTETLTTRDKIALFDNADVIVGSIGGGVCNVLFSNESTKLICLVSPTFLKVNFRFKFCLDVINTIYYDNCEHTEKSRLKTFMRVKIPSHDIIGEISHIEDDFVEVSYSKEKVAGWNSSVTFDKILMKEREVLPIDMGLNSSWTFDLKKFIFYFQEDFDYQGVK